VSSATPKAPFIPPVCARAMWQATPSTLGSSKPSTTILSSGPNNRNLVLTDPVVPRSGRLMIHMPSRTTTRRTALPRISPSRLKMSSQLPPTVSGRDAISVHPKHLLQIRHHRKRAIKPWCSPRSGCRGACLFFSRPPATSRSNLAPITCCLGTFPGCSAFRGRRFVREATLRSGHQIDHRPRRRDRLRFLACRRGQVPDLDGGQPASSGDLSEPMGGRGPEKGHFGHSRCPQPGQARWSSVPSGLAHQLCGSSLTPRNLAAG
jgi:hypothetical protein